MNRKLSELLRYGLNGVIATAAHYFVLYISLEILNISSAGLANLLASTVGITLSFFGNRYFVFRSWDEAILSQVVRFAGLYSFIAIMHGVVLFIWTDSLKLNYNIGFMIAVVIQVLMGYLGGKRFVFCRANDLNTN